MCDESMCSIYVIVFIAIVAIKLCIDGMISGPSILVHYPALPRMATENRHSKIAILFTLIIEPSPSSSNLIWPASFINRREKTIYIYIYTYIHIYTKHVRKYIIITEDRIICISFDLYVIQ